MKNTLAMFPGQGSQYVGMGRDLLSEFPYLKQIFEEAEDAIGVNLKKLCFDGPEETLRLTENTQPSILTISIAVWKVLVNEAGFHPNYYAGHSLGEYSALVASGKFEFSQAVKLVKARGAAMQKAVPEGQGAMAAVLNFDAENLVGLCSKITNSNSGSVEVVNFNSPKQLIISGSKTEVDMVVKALENEDKVRCAMLPVSAPFHSRLMSPAKEEMRPLLAAANLIKNDTKVIANLTGKIESPYTIDRLIDQIDSPVLWTQSLETCLHLGVENFVEIGPGRVLFGLARKSLERDKMVYHTEDIKESINTLKA